ncbi:MAG: hypothetical protein V1859_05380 [archaeon]
MHLLYRFIYNKKLRGVYLFLTKCKNLLFLKPVFLIDNRFFGIYNFIKHAYSIENNILPNKGITLSADDFLEKTNICYSADKILTTKIKNKPILVVGLSHDRIIEFVLLFSYLKREDIFLVGVKTFQLLGKNTSKYILPVLNKKYSNDSKTIMKKTGIDDLYLLENMSKKQIGIMNKKSLQMAADKINKGNAVIIFPTGVNHEKDPWRPGIIEILTKLNCNAYVLPVGFRGPNREEIFEKMFNSYKNRKK